MAAMLWSGMQADFHIARGGQSREIGYPHRKKALDCAGCGRPRHVRIDLRKHTGVSYEQEEHRSALVAFECLACLRGCRQARELHRCRERAADFAERAV